MRLRRAFGSPNHCMYVELCGWGRLVAPFFTFGAAVPGAYMPDLDHAGAILFWGYNPSVARLAHATAAVAAVAAVHASSSSTRAGPASPRRPTTGCGYVRGPMARSRSP